MLRVGGRQKRPCIQGKLCLAGEVTIGQAGTLIIESCKYYKITEVL